MSETVVAYRGPFSLAHSASFLCGFTPASGSSARDLDEEGRLTFGFLDERTFAPVAARVKQRSGDVVIEGPAAQAARILSLDHDATGLAELDDPVVVRALSERPGFRPVCFASAYEAAVWGILAQRVPMRAASAMKQKLAEHTGTVAVGFGQRFYPAPAPRALLDVESFPGLPAEKLARLHALSIAALDGDLDTEALRALPLDEALARVAKLRGVGSWTAELILLRGCGVRDALPESEPRVLAAIAEAYAINTPSLAEARRIAEAWRPYRMWVSVLLVSGLRNTARWNTRERRGAAPRAVASRRMLRL